jgi:insulysin
MYRTNHPTHSSSATTVLFQIESDSLMEIVILKMFVRIVEVPCFNQLRTKEQLGYAATADVLASDETHTTYFRILVQGTPHPEYVESRIDSFLKDFGETLNSMTDEEFELRKNAELDVHSMKPSTMAERVNRIFREIHQESLNFDRESLEIVLLQRLVLPDLQHFFEVKKNFNN